MTPEPPKITNTNIIIKHNDIQNTKLPISMILNRTKDNRSGRQTIKRFTNVVKKFLKVDISPMGTLPEDKIVTEAVVRQTPYVLLNKNAPISRAMNQMMNDYLNESKLEDIEQNNITFMDKVRKFIQIKKNRNE